MCLKLLQQISNSWHRRRIFYSLIFYIKNQNGIIDRYCSFSIYLNNADIFVSTLGQNKISSTIRLTVAVYKNVLYESKCILWLRRHEAVNLWDRPCGIHFCAKSKLVGKIVPENIIAGIGIITGLTWLLFWLILKLKKNSPIYSAFHHPYSHIIFEL